MTDLACPKQQRCPGCPLGDAPYAAGLARKGQELGRALARYGELSPEVAAPRGAAPTLGYRLRAKLVVAGRALGLYERGSHRVVDVEGCRVLSGALTAATRALRARLPLPIYGADFRETSEGVLITLLSEAPSHDESLTRVARELVESGDALSVALALRPPGNVRLIAGEPRVVAGPSAARHALAEAAPYAYAAHGGFVQAHAAQASHVHAQILARVGEQAPGRSPRVLELFAGNGSLALALARSGADVTAVEAYAPAISLAERAAREQGLKLLAVTSDATRFVLERAQGPFDVVLVNPPRRGLSPELRAALARARPRLLGYVSCNPRTLARDAAHLALGGMRMTHAEPLDMIPWSDAIEALCWFGPAAPPSPRVLYRDEHWVAVEKAAFEPMTASAGESLTARVRRLPGFADAEALEGWGAETSGVSWFSRPASLASVVSAERWLTLGVRGNLRKQGTITRHRDGAATAGARYKKRGALGRHSWVSASVHDDDERALLADFAGIGHPVLGDPRGDDATNQFLEHRFGLDRTFAHCHESRLVLREGTVLCASSELAPDLSQLVDSALDEPALERP